MHKSTARIRAPVGVDRTLRRLGAYLRLARKRRQMRQEDVAEVAGISRFTLRRIECGNPGTGIGSYVAVLHALALHPEMSNVAHPQLDWYEGLPVPVARRIRRVRLPEDLLTIEEGELGYPTERQLREANRKKREARNRMKEWRKEHAFELAARGSFSEE